MESGIPKRTEWNGGDHEDHRHRNSNRNDGAHLAGPFQQAFEETATVDTIS